MNALKSEVEVFNQLRAIYGYEVTATTPVATNQAVKLFLCLMAAKDLKMRQFDVVTAYLNAALKDSKVFMKQPTGFEVPGMICLILQAFYGLRQAANLWHECFTAALLQIRFKPLQADGCAFTRLDGDTYIIIYVDDAIIAAPTDQAGT